MSWYLEIIAVIVGVMLFLWSSAVVATGLAFLITDGRLGRREWYQVAFALVAFLVCIIGYLQLDSAKRPPPESGSAAPAP